MLGPTLIQQRFRGYLPVVIDIETGGFNSQTDALLEIGAALLDMNAEGQLEIQEMLHFHVQPFVGANLEPSALAFNKIDPFHPFRQALDEQTALEHLLKAIKLALKKTGCQKAILTGHNPAFDLSFLLAALNRTPIKRHPFHPFSCLDTASLSALALGQTVLAKALAAANITFDLNEAHSALYDAQKTAELFCYIVNRWQALGGWPLPAIVS